MNLDILYAILFACLPIAFISYLAVKYAYIRGYFSLDEDMDLQASSIDRSKLDKQLKSELKKRKKSKEQHHKMNILHSKWLTFGGGFYGLLALVTFIYIEFKQIFEFWIAATGLQYFIDFLTIGNIIGMFVDSILNMLKAIVWFSYWPREIEMDNPLFWLLMAYAGYKLGSSQAHKRVGGMLQNQSQNEVETDETGEAECHEDSRTL